MMPCSHLTAASDAQSWCSSPSPAWKLVPPLLTELSVVPDCALPPGGQTSLQPELPEGPRDATVTWSQTWYIFLLHSPLPPLCVCVCVYLEDLRVEFCLQVTCLFCLHIDLKRFQSLIWDLCSDQIWSVLLQTQILSRKCSVSIHYLYDFFIFIFLDLSSAKYTAVGTNFPVLHNWIINL